MKRLGIFCIYDKENKVDEYIFYLLQSICQQLCELIIVSNNNIDKLTEERLSAYTKKIIIRENIGFDAGAFREVIIGLIESNKIIQYDELVIFNDSFYGPFFDMNHIFDKMEYKNVDFWSLTKNTGKFNEPNYLQSYFIVVKKNMLHSEDFKIFWKDMPIYDSFSEVVLGYESGFAQYFEKCGYSWDSFVDNGEYDVERNLRKYRMSPYHFVPNEIMKKQGLPILKKKLFDLDAFSPDYGLNRQSHENFLDALLFIKNKTTYNINLIWDNVLRIYSLRNIQDNCCLVKTLSNVDLGFKSSYKRKIYMWLTNQEMTYNNLYRVYGKLMDKEIVIGTSSIELYEYISCNYRNTLTKVFNNVIDFFKFYLEQELVIDNDITAFFYDENITSDYDISYTDRQSVVWSKWENLFGESEYIENVFNEFKNEPRLGLAVIPGKKHGYSFSDKKHVDISEKYLNAFEIKKYADRSLYLADWSDCFWIRGNIGFQKLLTAIKKLERTEEKVEMSVVAKCLPYVLQKELYLTCVIQSQKYSSVYNSMNQIYLRRLVEELECNNEKLTICQLTRYKSFLSLNKSRIDEFIKKYEKILIYGCGEIADFVMAYINLGCVEAIVVSDNQNKPDKYKGIKVIYISEIEKYAADGIVLALSEKNAVEVKKCLQDYYSEKKVLSLLNGGKF